MLDVGSSLRVATNISIRNSIGRDFYEDNLHDSNLIPFFFFKEKDGSSVPVEES